MFQSVDGQKRSTDNFGVFHNLAFQMDLFGDLPKPGKSQGKISTAPWPVGSRKRTTSGGLFDDLPSTTSDVTSGSNTLYDEVPSNTEGNNLDKSNNLKRLANEDNQAGGDVKRRASEANDKIHYSLRGYFAERRGERDEMQDAHVINDNFLPDIEQVDPSVYRLAYYGVFDGHGGLRASKYACEYLHKNLADRFPKGDITQVEKEIKKIFLETFKKTDDDFLRLARAKKPSWKDGTTAVSILVLNETLYIANLGDSKAILCRYNDTTKKCIAIPLTKDHNPTSYEERMRIQKAGGTVREGRVMGQLEVSRSIGDGQYKTYGVSPIPDVKRCQLTDNDKFIMIACDGLWKTFTPEEAIDFVNKGLLDTSLTETLVKTEEEVRYDSLCNRLVTEAVRKLSGDNVTVIIVRIKHKN